MRPDLHALYLDVIVAHNKHPRNRRRMAAGHRAEGFNPLCGDRLTVYVQVERGVIQDVSFEGFGCAIAIASASLMSESVQGKTVVEAEALLERVQRMVTAPADTPIDDLGALTALAGVRRFPVRVKCATLAWQALRAAATAGDEVVTTESH
jgi:nitrogen fixation protein NifU and related proteins